MDTENAIQYWTELAEYDFETAKVMNHTKRFLYVGFMCHQSIEKVFKAYYVFKQGNNPPYTHNLMKLAKSGGFYSTLSAEEKDLIDTLEPLNIEARYPTHKEKLMRELNERFCTQLLERTKELFECIKEKL